MFSIGIDQLLNQYADWLTNKRVGLLTHPASLNSQGIHTADRLQQHPHINLTALFGPEHGMTGTGDAGKEINSAVTHNA